MININFIVIFYLLENFGVLLDIATFLEQDVE